MEAGCRVADSSKNIFAFQWLTLEMLPLQCKRCGTTKESADATDAKTHSATSRRDIMKKQKLYCSFCFIAIFHFFGFLF